MSDLPQPKTITAKDTKRPFHDPKNIPEPKTVTSKDTKGSGVGSAKHEVLKHKEREYSRVGASRSKQKNRVGSMRSRSGPPATMTRSRLISEPVASAKGVIDRIKRLESTFNSQKFRVHKMDLNKVDHKLNSSMSSLSKIRVPKLNSMNKSFTSLRMPKMKSFSRSSSRKRRTSLKVPKMSFKL